MRTITALWLLCVVYNIETVNAAAPTFDTPPSGGGSGSIAENVAVGSSIITLQATDTDGDVLTFTVASQTPATPAFTINLSDELEVPSGLDYETTQLFTLTLSVTDGTNTVTTTYTLTITDVDDESPIFSQNKYTATIVDSATAGTTVTTVTATDADSSSFIYSIQGAQATFAISTTGVITVSNPSGLSGLGGFVTLNIQANDTTNAPGMATVDITIQASPCNSSPCKNGGTCSNTGITTFSCACLSGYIGTTCERVDYCIHDPCNGGDCTSGATGYTCSNCDTCGKGTNCTDNKEGYCLLSRTCDALKKKCNCICVDSGKCEPDIIILIVLPLVVSGVLIISFVIIRFNKWRRSHKPVKEIRWTSFRMWCISGCTSFLDCWRRGPCCHQDNSTHTSKNGEVTEDFGMQQSQTERSKRKKRRKNNRISDDKRDNPFTQDMPGGNNSSSLKPLDVGKPPINHITPKKLPPIPSAK